MIELTKLKPFNLVEAKQGKPICTRNGRKARIICWNLKGDYPIVAAVETDNGTREEVFRYTKKGHYLKPETKDLDDLMMLPEKKEGFINAYKSITYTTKEEALKQCNKCDDYLDTVKITWYE